MYQKMEPLTLDEQNFAAVHYGVVFSFLKNRGLDAEEYHGIVIERYLLAVHRYLANPQLRRYSFYTIAKWAMSSALSNYWRSVRREQEFRSCCPLDIFEDVEPHTERDAIESRVEARETISRTMGGLDPKRKKTILLFAAGYTQKEIGRAEGITASGVSSRIFRIRRSPELQAAKTA